MFACRSTQSMHLNELLCSDPALSQHLFHTGGLAKLKTLGRTMGPHNLTTTLCLFQNLQISAPIRNARSEGGSSVEWGRAVDFGTRYLKRPRIRHRACLSLGKHEIALEQ